MSMAAAASNDGFGHILQAHDKNLLAGRRLDTVLLVGRLAQRLARLVYTE
jgi:hypothetical protein